MPPPAGASIPAETVAIHYTRPPGRVTVFRQQYLAREGDCVVTLMRSTPLERPLQVNGRTVLAGGDAAVWFTFDDAWHDIGRFHVAGAFTGCYANMLTPVVQHTPLHWSTTDLFLDVWLGADGVPALLDEDELDEALANGWVGAADGARARAEAARLLAAARRGEWPPPVVQAWPLARALAAADGTRGSGAV